MTTTGQQATEAGALTCVTCGYSLQGLAPDGTCPECGEAIARSTSTVYGFTKRELVVVACRLFALWLIVTGLMGVIGLAGWVIPMLIEVSGPDTWLWMMVHGMSLGTTLVLGGLLWWCAGWLAALMVRRDGLASAGRLNRRDVLHIALLSLGVYFVVMGLAEVANGALSIGTEQHYYAGPVAGLPSLMSGIVQLGAGILCILVGSRGGRAIGRIWHWGRTAGT